MENRALLAFVLSLAVFIGWGFILSIISPPPKEPTEQALQKQVPSGQQPGESSQGIASAPSAGTGTPAPATAVPAVPSVPQFQGTEKHITVTNGLITYILSNKGGMITDILMTKYKDDEGNPINLVAESISGLKPLALESSDPEISNILQNAFYQPSEQTLELSESKPDATLTLTLEHQSGLQVIREFTFHYQQFMIDIATRINAKTQALKDKNLSYNVLWGPGLGGQTQMNVEMFAHTGPTTFVNDERKETSESDIEGIVRFKGNLEWTAFQNKYFAAAMIPSKGIENAFAKKMGDEVFVGLEYTSVQSSTSSSMQVYAGNKELQILEDLGHKLVRLMDYGAVGNKFAFLVKPLLKSIRFFHGITGNYGWAIIFVTMIIKILFFPLSHKSFKSMKAMQKVQPYVKVIQERNKDDRSKMNEEMLELYKKHRVNPLGGCLPMLLQIPVFIALYHVLFFSIELRGEPFILWIKDLSVKDPYYIWPVMMGASMLLQQKMTPSVGDPMQQKIMMFLPIVFTFLFISFPAGLVLYWTVNNVLTIAQQYYIYKIAKD